MEIIWIEQRIAMRGAKIEEQAKFPSHFEAIKDAVSRSDFYSGESEFCNVGNISMSHHRECLQVALCQDLNGNGYVIYIDICSLVIMDYHQETVHFTWDEAIPQEYCEELVDDFVEKALTRVHECSRDNWALRISRNMLSGNTRKPLHAGFYKVDHNLKV